MNPAVFEKFAKASVEIKKWGEQHKLLLAVSGGVDSVVLSHLVASLKVNSGIAHINYGLRGEDSDLDAQFVADLSAKYGWELHLHTVSKEEWDMFDGSTQLKARKIRYKFFKQVLQENRTYGFVVLGHTLSDQLETILYNLIRGTGVKGMAGMLRKRSELIRPLLHITREEILEYAKEHGLTWREDSSNKECKYSRNIIRNEIIPKLKMLNPGLEQTFELNQFRFRIAYNALKTMVSRLGNWIEVDGCARKINMQKLSGLSRYKYAVYDLLSKYHVSSRVIHKLLEEPFSDKKKVFETRNHVLVHKNWDLRIYTKSEYKRITAPLLPAKFSRLELLNNIQLKDFFLTGRILEQIPSDLKLPPFEAYADEDKFVYPLIIRSRADGDAMKPLGLKGTKTISDLLTDKKIDHELRERLPVIVNGNGQIIWMPGVAFSELFKVKPTTKTVIHLRFGIDL
jgi:tRNA(Ile)-lysidine synthase